MAESAPEQPQQEKAQTEQKDLKITLSSISIALINSIKNIKSKSRPDDISRLTVSQTVSFLAIAYEKVRNAIEYREDHLIRRAAIERIMARRLSLNPEAKGEAENIIRELMWARYYPNGSLGEEDIETVQNIIDKYISLRKTIVTGRNGGEQHFLYEFLIDLLTCEIEETLSPEDATRMSNFSYFIYQTLRRKVAIDKLTEEQKDAYFLVSLEKAFRKSDNPYERYHLFVTFYQPISSYSAGDITQLAPQLPHIFKKIDEMIANLYAEQLTRFIRKHLPPYLILFDLFRKQKQNIEQVLTNKSKLWTEVEMTCREKYQQAKNRLQGLAVKSLIYIFITKMVFAIILEYPVSKWLYNEVNFVSIAINSLFPPILMLIIVLFFRLPGEDNTIRIYHRIVEIIDADKTFETTKAMNLSRKLRVKKPLLVFGFTIFYSFTFFVTLLAIHEVLQFLHFNLVSEAIFIFFVSVITFFSYRIKQVVNEYRLIVKENILTPLIDFFFMPMLSIGKFFSTQIGRLNFFIVIFDFIIEAPFKLIIEVIEEWISFVRARKEEIM